MKVQYSRLRNESSTTTDKGKTSNGMDGSEHHWRIPPIIWIPLMTCVVLLFILDVFQIQTYTFPSLKNLPIPELPQDDPELLRGFLIKNEGCRIPHMDPFDPSVLHCISKMEPPRCNNGTPPLYDSNLTSIFFLYSALPAYGIESVANLTCCYQPFWRRSPKNNELDDKVHYASKCIPLGDSAKIGDEFITVTCQHNGETIYRDYFAFVPLKEYSPPSASVREGAPLNVLVIGLDAVSRVNFHRQMPRTVEYLHNISAVELLGYNKVADNTFPNLIPVLTGHDEKTLSETCWKEDNRFDACTFMWNLYKKRGFVTAFGEDSSWMGIFNYMKKGFKHQPTDYMWGVWDRETESQIGNQHKMNVQQCVGSRPVYKVLLNYIDNFVETMHRAHRRYFAFFWGSSLSHDYLNMPNLGDEYYKTFFEQLYESGRLENTVLFFMSDHGIRWGEIRQTYQGRMEERLPFVFVVLPSWFREKYSLSYRNLQRNVRRLTTPFDLHETLVHLMNFSEPREAWLATEKHRGYSFFKDISPKRTCVDAEIPSHWCVCQQSFEVDRNSSVVQHAADAIVDHMNGLLKGYGQCAGLSLKAVSDARMMSHGDNILTGDVSFKDYTLTVQTEPGDGIFESTVRHHIGKNISNFEITGTISRLNLYGPQSLCITDFHLKLYCYCKSLLEVLSF